jgi:hypothetical protein
MTPGSRTRIIHTAILVADRSISGTLVLEPLVHCHEPADVSASVTVTASLLDAISP